MAAGASDPVQELAEQLSNASKNLRVAAQYFIQAAPGMSSPEMKALAMVEGQTLEHLANLYSVTASIVLSLPQVGSAVGAKLSELQAQLDKMTKISPDRMYG